MTNDQQILQGLEYAFMDENLSAFASLKPELLTNDFHQGKKVYLQLEKELEGCSSFIFSVAFITQSGLQLLKPVFRKLEVRKIPGKILTTDYLCFSQPAALDEISRFSNIELRMYQCEELDGFHTKGYFFTDSSHLSLIIGSSNLTGPALCTSKEWNAKLISTPDGKFARECLDEFNRLFESVQSVPYSSIRDLYIEQYAMVQRQRKHLQQASPQVPALIKPNLMQTQLVENLRKLISQKKSRALLISATATGKTYGAAFAVQEFKPKRILFLVHREQIARKAKESFQRVLGNQFTYGLLSGARKETDADYLFSTVQTMSREQMLQSFDPSSFDWIIIDEVHRAAAESYQKIFAHFQPSFWFGMSATPVRGDGQSIYELFDYNIAGRIGIKEALEEDLLCPFHYYAIDDLQIDDDQSHGLSDFHLLISEERIRHILEEAKFYGYSGSRVKGLMFVSSVQEARALSEKLNQNGLRTLALDGDSSMEEREAAIERLTKEGNENALDYLITVDIFNEGIDIPEINQVLLLRPTKSAIVFVQQMGRGLRKSAGKDYVVILDFIGLYQNNFMIPQALSEDLSGKKDNLRRFIAEGNKTLPGCATIHFSEQAKSRIFRSIQQATMNSAAVLMEGWLSLKEQLGRIPRLVDFEDHDAIDPILIFSNNSYPSYPDFLRKKAKVENLPEYSEQQLNFLRFISRKWANGKRPHELWMLQAMMEDEENWKDLFETNLKKNGYPLEAKTWINLKNQFEQNWLSGAENDKLRQNHVIFLEEKDGQEKITSCFHAALQAPAFRDALKDLIDFGLARWKNEYSHFVDGTWLNQNKSYSYADTFRLLDFEHSQVAQNVGGYVYDAKTNLFPVYINYDKSESISGSIAYEDHFASPSQLVAYSKAKRTLNSPDLKTIASAKENGTKILLFVRKNTEEQLKEFYYLGPMESDGRFEETCMPATRQKVVRIHYQLQRPVRFDLYDYFTRIQIQ